MQRRHFNFGLGAALGASLLAGVPLSARADDDGEFVILHARYGTEHRQVDVTDRLRELARQDRRFRLSNDLFGVDPAPGRDKTLQIFVRDRQGRERQVDYRERDWIDGGQFIGWSRGNWGESNESRGRHGGDRRDDGEFTILYATYGTGRREVDVTDRLRELARRDERFRLTNDVFSGIDPDPGQTKVLRIVARDRAGQQRSFEYREYQTVDGNQFIGWGRGDWGRRSDPGDWGPARPGGGRLVIESASYGAEDRWVDVTQALRAQVRGERFEAEVRNELFGFDPLPGRRKLLTVTYRLGNEPVRTVRVREEDVIRLP
ncbi:MULTISPECIES: hypothetical protein [Roseateles]|uniref:DUF3395 domain-containing protein n=1 Tax=Pelomonas aquatica TaxID=431058 RepID=A0ABU1Z603_9BURK|nr:MULTISPECIES: hypothetical protein [Roseateles]KQY88543.1 hypothetical protein ASD35_13380 [Pelomonas sp. Root1444]MDR7296066.1 hypothetical protein [Pelomonas aquatica]